MKKVLLTAMAVMMFGSFSYAMAANDEDANQKECNHKHSKHHGSKDIFISAYAKADTSSDIITKIKANDDGYSYTVFFCNEDKSWCEIVNAKDGSTAWINLEQVKNAEEEYAKRNHKRMMFESMVKQTQEQNVRIENLEKEVATLTQQLSAVLTAQQKQINQLQTAYYQ